METLLQFLMPNHRFDAPTIIKMALPYVQLCLMVRKDNFMNFRQRQLVNVRATHSSW